LKLSSRDMHMSYYLSWMYPVMHIIISISPHVIISYDMINSYDLKDQILFQVVDKVIWTSFELYLCDLIISVESGLSHSQYTRKSIHSNNNLNTVFSFLEILCLDHTLTSLYTSFNTSIHRSITSYFELSKQSKYISKFTYITKFL